jgi:hypothetical protein
MASTKAYLRALLAIPCMLFVLLLIGTVLPRDPLGPMGFGNVAFVFLIILAINLYGAISSLHKRVSDLETRHAGSGSPDKSS